MKYVDEFRDGELAKNIAANIAREATAESGYRLMEFCGGHTHAVTRRAERLPRRFLRRGTVPCHACRRSGRVGGACRW
ncbi:MAG: hypothetical protein IPP36_06965 [Nitrosomonadales bacterium]|nr:hypothetical protein [Nitrosomonadales bacterium]